MRELDQLFAALARSRFHSGFRLGSEDAAYLERHDLGVALDHAATFVRERPPFTPRSRSGRTRPSPAGC
jgi:hypothetical protein